MPQLLQNAGGINVGSRTIPLTDHSMRVLWPVKAGRKSVTAAPSKRVEKRISSVVEYEVSLPPRRLGPFTSKYIQAKLEFGGKGKVKAPLLNGNIPSKSELTLERARGEKFVVKLETKLNEHVSSEIGVGLKDADVSAFANHIAHGEWKKAMSCLFSVAKLKAAFRLSDSVSVGWEFELSGDADLCVFAATGKIVILVPLDGLPQAPSGLTAEFEGEITVRFGPSKALWEKIARRVGGPVLRAAINQMGSAAARNALIGALEAGGLFVLPIAAAVAPLYVLYKATQARNDGHMKGLISDYCVGYIHRIAFANSSKQHEKSNLRAKGSRNELSTAGWRDAEWAMSASSKKVVEEKVIYHFGSDFDRAFFSGDIQNVRSRVGNRIDTNDDAYMQELVHLTSTMTKQIENQQLQMYVYLVRVLTGDLIRQPPT